MNNTISLEELWDAYSPTEEIAPAEASRPVPTAVRRYQEHTIAPGTPPASAVRLQMRGEIKLQGWLPFTAEQVIRRGRGMIWQATVQGRDGPISGLDRMVDGEGSMRWTMPGDVPLIEGSGPDITRSAIGRVQIESIWLPPLLCQPEVAWTQTDSHHIQAQFTAYGETTRLELAIDDTGRVESIVLPRWGNVDGAAFHYMNFGGVVEEEKTFAGYTIPSRLRVGWYFGTDRFESDGEFFRATVDNATYR